MGMNQVHATAPMTMATSHRGLALTVNSAVLEGTRLDRMLPHTDRRPGLRPEWQGVSAGVESYLVTPAEVSVEQIELLERVRVAAGQTS